MHDSGYINGQGLEPYGSMKYMLTNLGRAGCGPIALYNLLISLGEDADLDDIIKHCEKYSILSLYGMFGTHTAAVAAYLKKKGLRVRLKMYPSVAQAERCLRRYGGGIVNYFWGRGSHYVFVRPSDDPQGGLAVYNAGNRSPHERYVSSLKNLAGTGRLFVLWSVLCAQRRR